MSLIAVGDIHGCAQTLKALWEELPVDEVDQIVFVGDYIDRGPDSRGVIDFALEIDQHYPCIFLRGNHEAMMLDYLDGNGYHIWSRNGGMQTLQSYENGRDELNIPEEHRRFLEQTRIFYETDDFFFVHGGVKPKISIEENKRMYGEDVFLWERSHLENSDADWEKAVVCGHTPITEPILRPNLIAIDTGCVFQRQPGLGRLTAVLLPEREIISVPFQG